MVSNRYQHCYYHYYYYYRFYHLIGGKNWTLTNAPKSYQWHMIASDSSGTYLAACTLGYGIYTSTSGGNSWTRTSAPIGFWNAVASNIDGTNLAAVLIDGGIYTSTSG
jgi:hypothetical protein